MPRLLFVFFLLLYFSHFLSYIGWNNTLGGQIGQIILFLIILYLFLKRKIQFKQSNLQKYIYLFMFVPFLSVLSAAIIHSQGIWESLHATRYNLAYFVFFLLFAFDIKESQLVKVFCLLGVSWCFIEIIQQFTYPDYWFATRYDTFERSLEIRNGIYRFNVAGREFGLIMLFYCFEKFLKSRNYLYLWGICLGLIGIYLLATRQIMVASILCLLFGVFFMKRMKIGSLIFLCLLSYLVYANSKSLFGEFVEMTSDINKDYVRFVAYKFYGTEFNKDKMLPILFGNGEPAPNSSYGQEINELQRDYGLWRADIGVVGMYSLYGLFYILAIIAFFVYIFKNRSYIDIYLRMYVLFMLLTSVMLYHFGYSYERIVIMSCILYLIDKSITRNKQQCLHI